ncbi:protein LURP-one-related 7 [Cornus florida]|uniref:protein LURP-one-related 7 n=1 Tax=Cornus florida TaxID=4283 RepID=UPI002896CE9E|nr:protein LURP-one-related 7 [Cornus florida]
MDDTSAPPEFPNANLKIPVDLFVSKKHHGLRFADASGDLVFSVDIQSSNSTPPRRKRVLDASENPLITLYRNHNGSWQGFKAGDTEEYLIFEVERTPNSPGRTEFEVVLVGEHSEDSNSDFKMKGCPSQRSCTIYRGNSIVAQTSLMYKLGIRRLFVTRRRFRLTIFPEFVDHPLVVALIVIFFDGRKLWI